jgi:DNA-directed RNA polymerase subunit beta
MLSPSGVHYADVSPRQVLSVSTGQIPFIGSDDGVRTMYASNMQRQAVPLVKPIAATIGSGSEYKIAKDSGVTVTAEEDGEVIFVDANKIVIANKNDKKTTYKLIKYRRSNQNTSVNQIPIVNVGQKVVKDEIIADGPATQNGELALGRNPLIAFTT